MKEVLVYAPAKINLILRVLDRRTDGYHNLWSLMQTVGVEDELYVHLTPRSSGIRLSCDDPLLPTDGRNLIVRAADVVLERAGLSVGLDIRVVKRIPISAGLGGGSSDAAATIVALNQLLGLKWSGALMATIGQVLGSDVPFFFFSPAAQVRGRGEEVSPVIVSGERWIVLLNPGFPIETRWAYDRLSSTRPFIAPLADSIISLMQQPRVSWDDVVPLMENDFEHALSSTHPVLSAMKQSLLNEGAEAAMLSGSGATVFGVFRGEEPALRARDEVKRRHGWWSAAAPAGTAGLTWREIDPLIPLQVS